MHYIPRARVAGAVVDWVLSETEPQHFCVETASVALRGSCLVLQQVRYLTTLAVHSPAARDVPSLEGMAADSRPLSHQSIISHQLVYFCLLWYAA